MWFTEKPPLAQAAQARVAVVAATPVRVPRAAAMLSRAAAAPQNPADATQAHRGGLTCHQKLPCAHVNPADHNPWVPSRTLRPWAVVAATPVRVAHAAGMLNRAAAALKNPADCSAVRALSSQLDLWSVNSFPGPVTNGQQPPCPHAYCIPELLFSQPCLCALPVRLPCSAELPQPPQTLQTAAGYMPGGLRMA